MNLPSFSDFAESVNRDAMAYDFERLLAVEAEKSGYAFTREQLRLMVNCCFAVSAALLRAYHEWLSETRPS